MNNDEIALLHRGLDWIGFKRKGSMKQRILIKRFKSMFGESPAAITKLFIDCKAKKEKFSEKYAFMTLQWLKTYALEVDLAGRYKCCERTVEKMVKEYARLFKSFKGSKIRFGGFDQRTYQYSVDGKNFDTYEFRMKPSTQWYNHKSHSAGVKYEFALSLWESRCVSMRGPFPCGVNDYPVYRGGDKGSASKDKSALYYKVKDEKNAEDCYKYFSINSHHYFQESKAQGHLKASLIQGM